MALNSMIKEAVLASLLLATFSAWAQNPAYVVHGGGNDGSPFGGQLGILDLDSGEYYPITVLGSMTGLAADGNYLYAYDTQTRSILQLTGCGEVLDSVPISGDAYHLTDMAYRPTTGVFYAAGADDDYWSALYEVDVDTGDTTFIDYIDDSNGWNAIAAAPDGSVYLHQTNAPNEFLEIDPTDGSLIDWTQGGVPGGALGLAVDPVSGDLIASECCGEDGEGDELGERVYSLDPDTGTATLLWDLDDDRRIHDLAFFDVPSCPSSALFNVTADFSDDLDAEVEVTLTCNGGLPLEQTTTITGGDTDGVTFIVTNLPAIGASCEITHSTPTGYEATLSHACSLDNVAFGSFPCEISYEALPGEYVVTKEWLSDGETTVDIAQAAEVTVSCDADILAVDGEDISPDTTYELFLQGDNDSATLTVSTVDGAATCSAVEDELPTEVEVSYSEGCDNASVERASSASCTITNTVFYEGIPTLDRYSMGLLVLLMLGAGFLGVRRFS